MLAVRRHIGRVRDTRSLLLAIPAALVSGVVALLLGGQLMTIRPVWLAFSVHAAVIAGVWMFAGGSFAPRTVMGLSVIFALGAMLAWYFDRVIIFATSPYAGLTQFVAACAVASAVWRSHARDADLFARRAALIMPMGTVVVAFVYALGWPQPGVAVQMTAPGGQPVRVLTATEDERVTGMRYLWVRDDRLPAGTADSVPVRLELDPGSGDTPVILHHVSDDRARRDACALFWRETQRMAAGEVAAGVVPWVITQLPLREGNCDGGSMWTAERSSR